MSVAHVAQSTRHPRSFEHYGEKLLLVAGTHGKGRTVAWTSDIGPHWLPPEFVDWDGNARLWRQTLTWLAAGEAR